MSKREKLGLKHFNDPKPFIEYANNMQHFYKNSDEHNLVKNVKY